MKLRTHRIKSGWRIEQLIDNGWGEPYWESLPEVVTKGDYYSDREDTLEGLRKKYPPNPQSDLTK